MMRGKRENFFSREKKFSLSPRAPLSLSRKAEKLYLFDKVLIYVKYVKDWGCGKTQNAPLPSADAVRGKESVLRMSS